MADEVVAGGAAEAELPAREAMEFDVVIVGAGPAGLAAAIRLKQLAAEAGAELSVVVLEKGSEVGAHILSGAVVEVWHTDTDGDYGTYRGIMKTGADGGYRFATIVPGTYASPDRLDRVVHIHFKVGHPDGQPIEMEVAFEGDPRLDTDPDAEGAIVIPLTADDSGDGSTQRAVFDIVLKEPPFR